jgi:hypothetical protein
LTYSVALALPANAIATADRLLSPTGLASMDGGTASVAPQLSSNALHALGSAELHFQRPRDRNDNREEFPSLFNPYWQARLIATTAVERNLTAPSRGLGVDPFGFLP